MGKLLPQEKRKHPRNPPVIIDAKPRKGGLSDYGYHVELPTKARRAALMRAADAEGFNTIIKRISLIATLNHYRSPLKAKVLKKDQEWLSEKAQLLKSVGASGIALGPVVYGYANTMRQAGTRSSSPFASRGSSPVSQRASGPTTSRARSPAVSRFKSLVDPIKTQASPVGRPAFARSKSPVVAPVATMTTGRAKSPRMHRESSRVSSPEYADQKSSYWSRLEEPSRVRSSTHRKLRYEAPRRRAWVGGFEIPSTSAQMSAHRTQVSREPRDSGFFSNVAAFDRTLLSESESVEYSETSDTESFVMPF